MGKTIIGEEAFPAIIEEYNSGGKTAAYAYLRDQYGIKHPYTVIRRIRKCGKYSYNPETDRFSEADINRTDSLFLDLDQLCGSTAVATKRPGEPIPDTRPAAMEKLVHELISDRLLLLRQYITMDPSTKSVIIDKTSLAADGYRVVTY